MPKTLLAVDDSVTMRKVLEITFASDDFRVLGAEDSQKALTQLSEEPLAAVIDTSLDGDDGYALAKQIRARDPKIAIVLLASRYNPYDANRGRDSGADDYADKPFDTQGLLDKVKKAIATRDVQRAVATPVAPATAPGPMGPPILGAPQPRPSVAGAVPSRGPAPAGPRGHTLSYDSGPAAAVPEQPAPNPFPATKPSIQRVVPPAAPTKGPAPAHVVSVGPAPAAKAIPAPSPHNFPTTAPPAAPPPPLATAPAPPAPIAVPPAMTAAAPAAATVSPAAIANGHLAGKLDGLGLTPQQVEAVLSLSRDLVERVVWEVVPVLAETMIREEIARLTKES